MGESCSAGNLFRIMSLKPQWSGQLRFLGLCVIQVLCQRPNKAGSGFRQSTCTVGFLLQREIWAIRIRLQLANRIRDLALFNLAIDSK